MDTPPQAAPGSASVLVGRILQDRYRIDVVLGEGGMGAVYQAEHLLMHKRVAIKVLHPELTRVPEVVARFEREAMAAAHIDHPNVAAATDFGKLSDGSFFLVLEFVEGRSLREAIAEGPLEPGRAAAITKQVLAGLQRAHALGIVHRDLKPENIMLVPREGSGEVIKILDFGIAKVPMGDLMAANEGPKREALTQLGMVYGTPEYMAPEQALGEEIDARADLYALGVVLFEMLTGRRPFDAPTKVQILGLVVSQPVPKLRALYEGCTASPSLEAFVRKLLEKTPQGRFADARSALEALDAVSLVASPEPVPVAAPTAEQDPRKAAAQERPPLASRLTLAAAIAGVVVAALVLVGVLSKRQPDEKQPPPGGLVGRAPVGSAVPPPEASPAELDAAKDVAAAEALTRKYPDDVKTASHLVRVELAEKQYARAVLGIEALSSKDPRVAAAKEIREGLVEAVVSDASDQTFVLLASPKLGSDGPDVLYDVSTAPQMPVPQQKRAEGLLGEQAIRERASPALRVALDLRATAGMATKAACTARTKLLPVAKEQGDGRALLFVAPLAKAACGYFHNAPCHPCLARSDLPGTIAALTARPWK